MSASLVIERAGAVARVTLNRPDRLNALDVEATRALRDYFRDRSDDRDCRVILLAGTGRGFCAGFDLASGHMDRVESGIAGGLQVQRAFREIVVAMRRCPQPIVALLHGAVAGAGLSLALAADIRIAAESAKLSAAFVKVGLSGGDMGSSYFLPRLIGAARARELLLTGGLVDAAGAERIGLVGEVVPEADLAAAGEQRAAALLDASPLGQALTNQVLDANIDPPCPEAALALEDRTQVLLGQTADFRNAAAAFREKRKPEFKGR
jgi:enoyl-CoA hydratase/carnithine racemase